MKTIFKPVEGHILIEPEEITEVAKAVVTDGGETKKIIMSHHTQDKIQAAVNKGRVMISASSKYIVDEVLVYYPYCPNKIKLDEKMYDIIHERDVMGKVETT